VHRWQVAVCQPPDIYAGTLGQPRKKEKIKEKNRLQKNRVKI